MKAFRIIAILVVLAGILIACGGGGNQPRAPQARFQPPWWNQADSPDFVFAYGIGDGTNERIARASALSNAQSQAAMAVEARVRTMTRDFIQESGVQNPEVLRLTSQVTEAVAATTFRGARETNSFAADMPDGRVQVWIQYAVPIAAINGEVHGRIVNEEALYNEFKATQAFQLLDHAVNRGP